MRKKVYRYFFDAVEGQERWLNQMAARGFRLVGTTRVCYEFESCAPSEYVYKLEFVADQSSEQRKAYQEFLEEMGYRTFCKNIKLNYSFGKIQWRPYAKGAGMLATSPGSINKELLILEKRADGKPIELHTASDDLLSYYRSIRNAYLYAALVMAVLVLLGGFSQQLKPLAAATKIFAAGLGGFMAYLTMRYTALIYHIKQKRRILE